MQKIEQELERVSHGHTDASEHKAEGNAGQDSKKKRTWFGDFGSVIQPMPWIANLVEFQNSATPEKQGCEHANGVQSVAKTGHIHRSRHCEIDS